MLLTDASNSLALTSPNSSCLSEEDFASLQEGFGSTSRTSTTSERQSESTLDDFMGEFGEAAAPRADMDEFDTEISSSSNLPSETSDASSVPQAGILHKTAHAAGPAYSYPMGFEMNEDEDEREEEDDVIPEMEETLMPVRHERSLSFGAAEVIEYEQVIVKDEDLIGADREGDEDDEDEEDVEVDLHFPVGAADDYRPPNKDHLLSSHMEEGLGDPFEHHHTRDEEDSGEEGDLEGEEFAASGKPTAEDEDYDQELREGAVNRTGFADDVVDDGLDKHEIRNYTEARSQADRTQHGGECHFNERYDREPKAAAAGQDTQDLFGLQLEADDDDGGAAETVTHTSHQTLVLVSTDVIVTCPVIRAILCSPPPPVSCRRHLCVAWLLSVQSIFCCG